MSGPSSVEILSSPVNICIKVDNEDGSTTYMSLPIAIRKHPEDTYKAFRVAIRDISSNAESTQSCLQDLLNEFLYNLNEGHRIPHSLINKAQYTLGTVKDDARIVRQAAASKRRRKNSTGFAFVNMGLKFSNVPPRPQTNQGKPWQASRYQESVSMVSPREEGTMRSEMNHGPPHIAGPSQFSLPSLSSHDQPPVSFPPRAQSADCNPQTQFFGPYPDQTRQSISSIQSYEARATGAVSQAQPLISPVSETRPASQQGPSPTQTQQYSSLNQAQRLPLPTHSTQQLPPSSHIMTLPRIEDNPSAFDRSRAQQSTYSTPPSSTVPQYHQPPASAQGQWKLLECQVCGINPRTHRPSAKVTPAHQRLHDEIVQNSNNQSAIHYYFQAYLLECRKTERLEAKKRETEGPPKQGEPIAQRPTRTSEGVVKSPDLSGSQNHIRTIASSASVQQTYQSVPPSQSGLPGNCPVCTSNRRSHQISAPISALHHEMHEVIAQHPHRIEYEHSRYMMALQNLPRIRDMRGEKSDRDDLEQAEYERALRSMDDISSGHPTRRHLQQPSPPQESTREIVTDHIPRPVTSMLAVDSVSRTFSVPRTSPASNYPQNRNGPDSNEEHGRQQYKIFPPGPAADRHMALGDDRHGPHTSVVHQDVNENFEHDNVERHQLVARAALGISLPNENPSHLSHGTRNHQDHLQGRSSTPTSFATTSSPLSAHKLHSHKRTYSDTFGSHNASPRPCPASSSSLNPPTSNYNGLDDSRFQNGLASTRTSNASSTLGALTPKEHLSSPRASSSSTTHRDAISSHRSDDTYPPIVPSPACRSPSNAELPLPSQSSDKTPSIALPHPLLEVSPPLNLAPIIVPSNHSPPQSAQSTREGLTSAQETPSTQAACKDSPDISVIDSQTSTKVHPQSSRPVLPSLNSLTSTSFTNINQASSNGTPRPNTPNDPRTVKSKEHGSRSPAEARADSKSYAADASGSQSSSASTGLHLQPQKDAETKSTVDRLRRATCSPRTEVTAAVVIGAGKNGGTYQSIYSAFDGRKAASAN